MLSVDCKGAGFITCSPFFASEGCGYFVVHLQLTLPPVRYSSFEDERGVLLGMVSGVGNTLGTEKTKKGTQIFSESLVIVMVAGAGFEPTTFGL